MQVTMKDGSVLTFASDAEFETYLRLTGHLPPPKTEAQIMRDRIDAVAVAEPVNGNHVNGMEALAQKQLPRRKVFFTAVEGRIIEFLAEVHPRGLTTMEIAERLRVVPSTGVSTFSRLNVRLRAHNIPLIVKVQGLRYMLNVDLFNAIELDIAGRAGQAQLKWDEENGYRG